MIHHMNDFLPSLYFVEQFLLQSLFIRTTLSSFRCFTARIRAWCAFADCLVSVSVWLSFDFSASVSEDNVQVTQQALRVRDSSSPLGIKARSPALRSDDFLKGLIIKMLLFSAGDNLQPHNLPRDKSHTDIFRALFIPDDDDDDGNHFETRLILSFTVSRASKSKPDRKNYSSTEGRRCFSVLLHYGLVSSCRNMICVYTHERVFKGTGEVKLTLYPSRFDRLLRFDGLMDSCRCVCRSADTLTSSQMLDYEHHYDLCGGIIRWDAFRSSSVLFYDL